MKAIILAAGGGSRLAPIGITTPKVLIPILNQPLLYHHIQAIKELVDEAIVVIGPNQFGQLIQGYINSQAWPIKISTVIQPKPIGTANSYQAAASLFKRPERLLCLNGDDLYSPKDVHQLAQYEFAVLGKPVSDPEKWGIFQSDAEGYLLKMVEKPEQFIGNLANTGAFVANTEIFDLYHQLSPSVRGEYEITDTHTLLAQKHQIKVVEVQDYWLPIGYPWHILLSHEELLSKQTNRLVVGENVQIGQNVLFAGTVVIGDNSIIHDNAIVNNSTIFNNSTIGAKSKIISSVIGKHVTIGKNVVTLNQLPSTKNITSTIGGNIVDTGLQKFGATIGDNAIIQSNTTVYPGRKIWPGSIIPDNSVVKEDVAN